jgi:hypothetical protein
METSLQIAFWQNLLNVKKEILVARDNSQLIKGSVVEIVLASAVEVVAEIGVSEEVVASVEMMVSLLSSRVVTQLHREEEEPETKFLLVVLITNSLKKSLVGSSVSLVWLRKFRLLRTQTIMRVVDLGLSLLKMSL